MEISAHVRNASNEHEVQVSTAGNSQRLSISAKASGRGSSINGGEFLMAAVATCYCNDLYREADRLGVPIDGCEVIATAQFNGAGLAAESITYSARIESSAPPEQIEHLLSETARLAEVHTTLRTGCAVRRIAWHHPT